MDGRRTRRLSARREPCRDVHVQFVGGGLRRMLGLEGDSERAGRRNASERVIGKLIGHGTPGIRSMTERGDGRRR